MRFIVLALLFSFFMAAPAVAQVNGKYLTVDLDSDHVNITTGFNGAHLSLFGVKKQPGDIAIVIQGPTRRMVVRRKDQVMGLWMNREAVDFRNVPVYYDIALSKAEDEIAPAILLQGYGIGLDALDFHAVVAEKEKGNAQRFKEALIRNKQRQGYFPLEPKNIIFMDDDFFRANFYMPADVPTGVYTIKTYLFENGAIADINETKLRVAQVGFSARLYRFAMLHGLAYGLVAVLFALFSAGSVWLFLRKE